MVEGYPPISAVPSTLPVDALDPNAMFGDFLSQGKSLSTSEIDFSGPLFDEYAIFDCSIDGNEESDELDADVVVFPQNTTQQSAPRYAADATNSCESCASPVELPPSVQHEFNPIPGTLPLKTMPAKSNAPSIHTSNASSTTYESAHLLPQLMNIDPATDRSKSTQITLPQTLTHSRYNPCQLQPGNFATRTKFPTAQYLPTLPSLSSETSLLQPPFIASSNNLPPPGVHAMPDAHNSAQLYQPSERSPWHSPRNLPSYVNHHHHASAPSAPNPSRTTFPQPPLHPHHQHTAPPHSTLSTPHPASTHLNPSTAFNQHPFFDPATYPNMLPNPHSSSTTQYPPELHHFLNPPYVSNLHQPVPPSHINPNASCTPVAQAAQSPANPTSFTNPPSASPPSSDPLSYADCTDLPAEALSLTPSHTDPRQQHSPRSVSLLLPTSCAVPPPTQRGCKRPHRRSHTHATTHTSSHTDIYPPTHTNPPCSTTESSKVRDAKAPKVKPAHIVKAIRHSAPSNSLQSNQPYQPQQPNQDLPHSRQPSAQSSPQPSSSSPLMSPTTTQSTNEQLISAMSHFAHTRTNPFPTSSLSFPTALPPCPSTPSPPSHWVHAQASSSQVSNSQFPPDLNPSSPSSTTATAAAAILASSTPAASAAAVAAGVTASLSFPLELKEEVGIGQAPTAAAEWNSTTAVPAVLAAAAGQAFGPPSALVHRSLAEIWEDPQAGSHVAAQLSLKDAAVSSRVVACKRQPIRYKQKREELQKEMERTVLQLQSLSIANKRLQVRQHVLNILIESADTYERYTWEMKKELEEDRRNPQAELKGAVAFKTMNLEAFMTMYRQDLAVASNYVIQEQSGRITAKDEEKMAAAIRENVKGTLQLLTVRPEIFALATKEMKLLLPPGKAEEEHWVQATLAMKVTPEQEALVITAGDIFRRCIEKVDEDRDGLGHTINTTIFSPKAVETENEMGMQDPRALVAKLQGIFKKQHGLVMLMAIFLCEKVLTPLQVAQGALHSHPLLFSSLSCVNAIRVVAERRMAAKREAGQAGAPQRAAAQKLSMTSLAQKDVLQALTM